MVLSAYHQFNAERIRKLNDIANRIRLHSIRCATASGTGDILSCGSCAEIMATLYFDTMRYDPNDPMNPNADCFILSKGHACPALYGAWVEAGFYPEAELDKMGTSDSELEGRPSVRSKYVDIACCGSLGQGLGCAAGIAYVSKYLDNNIARKVFCLLGDGESQEGAVFEALSFASFNNLNNLIIVLDINSYGQSDVTMLKDNMNAYRVRFEAFGWRTINVDGHDVVALASALNEARDNSVPTCILAKTNRGRGILSPDEISMGITYPLPKEIINKADDDIRRKLSSRDAFKAASHGLNPRAPDEIKMERPVNLATVSLPKPPTYKIGERIATRMAFGLALCKLGGECDRLLVMDSDVSNSTMTNMFRTKYPERFVECFIAEQNMISVATGAAARDRAIVFASTLGCFLPRAHDQLRIAAISNSNINIMGSHAGLSSGPAGVTLMALDDLAMFRSLPNSTIFCPSDAVSTERAVELAARTPGLTYIRTSRFPSEVIYKNEEQFSVASAKIVLSPPAGEVPNCTIISAGFTLIETLKAAENLARSGYKLVVVDLFTLKPLDVKTIVSAVRLSSGRLVIVEDHYAEGGIGEAVMAALEAEASPPVTITKMRHLAIRDIPSSGPDNAILAQNGIDAGAITVAIHDVYGAEPQKQQLLDPEIALKQVLRFMLTKDGKRPFLYHMQQNPDGGGILIFATSQGFRRLVRAKRWFLDGTFKMAPEHFFQMFSIHTIEKQIAVPNVYVLMAGKSADDYTTVFEQTWWRGDIDV